MRLKNISVSERNYTALKNLGKAGESFNDVISDLIKRVTTTENPRVKNNFNELRPDHRPGIPGQTVHPPTQ